MTETRVIRRLQCAAFACLVVWLMCGAFGWPGAIEIRGTLGLALSVLYLFLMPVAYQEFVSFLSQRRATDHERELAEWDAELRGSR